MSIISTFTRPWGLYGALALSAALAAGLVWQTLQLAGANVARAQAERATDVAKREAAEDRVKQERVSRETIQAYRQLEAAMTAAIREAERVRATETERSQRIAAGLAVERDRLRGDIAAFATGEREATSDSLAACIERAATLGNLLEGALRSDAAHTGAAEEHATDVRALRAAWPVSAP